MRKTLAVLAVAGVLFLGGCAGTPPETDGGSDGGTRPDSSDGEEAYSEEVGDVAWVDRGAGVWEMTVTLRDGRTKVCLVSQNTGGMDCFPTAVEEEQSE